MIPDIYFGHILCPDGTMFQISHLEDEPKPDHNVGSRHTTILALSTIVPGCLSGHCLSTIVSHATSQKYRSTSGHQDVTVSHLTTGFIILDW